MEDPRREGMAEPPPVTSYRGSSTLTVQVQDINRVAPLLDAAVQAGASAVQGLSFGLRDDTPQRRQALEAAIADARPRAEAAARAAGLTVTGVRAVVEQPINPPRGGAGGFGGGDGIATGEISVGARALVTFDVSR
jgi:uncharacterized protein YggE